jgi:hypothetical protein
MKRTRKPVRLLVFIAIGIALSFGLPLFPSIATESSDLILGTTPNFALNDVFGSRI